MTIEALRPDQRHALDGIASDIDIIRAKIRPLEVQFKTGEGKTIYVITRAPNKRELLENGDGAERQVID